MVRTRGYKRFVFVAAACLILAGAAVLTWLYGAFLPTWIRWSENKTLVSAAERVEVQLLSRGVTVSQNGVQLWESSAAWKVQDILLCDINHDKENEILLLCWKRGRYGPHRPFWVKEDEADWSQHIFIYSLEEGRVKAEWMASYLPFDVIGWSFDENTRLTLIEPSGRKTHWDWLQWGLEIIEDAS